MDGRVKHAFVYVKMHGPKLHLAKQSGAAFCMESKTDKTDKGPVSFRLTMEEHGCNNQLILDMV